MTFLHIALKDLSIRLRDRNTLVLMIILPVALTAIIGFAFGGESSISTVELTLVPASDDDLLTWAAAGLLSQVELFEVDVLEEDEAAESVMAGRRSAAVVVPSGLVEAVLEGTPAEVRILKDPASTIKAGIVQSLVERFATYASAGSALARGIAHALSEEHPLTDAEQLVLFGWMFPWMQEAWSHPPIAIEEISEEVKEIDAHSYFAPSFAVLFLLFTVLGSAKSIHEERESGTYERLMGAPLLKSSIIAGKLTGTYALAVVQILILIALGRILFGIDWGSHVGAVVVMALVTAAGASSLAVLIAAAARTGRQTDQVGTVLILLMSLVGGSMWPLELAPEGFKTFSRFTFNYWAHSGFNDLVFRDAGLAGISHEVLVIGAMTIVFFTLSVRLLARR